MKGGELKRGAFEGVWNVVRFNWHFFALVGFVLILILSTFHLFSDFYQGLLLTLVFLILMPVLISLKVSHYVYDCTGLYEMNWLDKYGEDISIASFNAGFDETTYLIKAKKPKAKVIALDFYDEKRHTELSIKRANKAYPSVPGTLKVETDNIPLEAGSIDLVLGFLSIHEIRDKEERVVFFKKLKEVVKTQGKIIVIEHLRDLPNFLAYTLGFMHFLSRATWYDDFKSAGLELVEEEKINPFMSKFTLSHGVTS